MLKSEKLLRRLLDQLRPPEKCCALFRRNAEPEPLLEEALHRILSKAMPFYDERDVLYRIAVEEAGRSGKAQRALLVLLKFAPPRQEVLESVAPSVGLGAVKRLHRMALSSPPKNVLPTLEQVAWAVHNEHKAPAVFGVSISELLADPLLSTDVPSGEKTFAIPTVLVFLCSEIIRLHGCSTEGIFRIPAAIDAAHNLRCFVEQHADRLDRCRSSEDDALVPASLLKQWLRWLPEPLLPARTYHLIAGKQCSLRKVLDSIPTANRHVFLYLVRFLQTICSPLNQNGTRMTPKALATIFAPNLARSEEIRLRADRDSEGKTRFYPLQSVASTEACVYSSEPMESPGERIQWIMAGTKIEIDFLEELLGELL